MSTESRLAYIRRAYGVPAKLGARVTYTYPSAPRTGTITGARHGRILVKFDDVIHATPMHPTWEITYL